MAGSWPAPPPAPAPSTRVSRRWRVAVWSKTWALDSGIFGCVWHRLFADLCLPADCAITIEAKTADELPPFDLRRPARLPVDQAGDARPAPVAAAGLALRRRGRRLGPPRPRRPAPGPRRPAHADSVADAPRKTRWPAGASPRPRPQPECAATSS